MADRKPILNIKTLGQTGLPVYAGRVADEILPELQGDRGRRIFREMSESDPIIGGVLLGVEMLSRQVTWSVRPARERGLKEGDEPSEDFKNKAKEVADFVDEALSDMSPSFGDTLSEVLSMLTYGWSWLEILYKRREGYNRVPRKNSRFDDGKVAWAGWSIRSQETLDTWQYENDDGSGELLGLNQWVPWATINSPTRTVMIPRWKSLHFTTRSRRENPEGISMLRNCYRPWYFKNNIEKIEGIGIERDLAGLPVIYAPHELFSADAGDEEKALLEELKKIATNIKRDEQEGLVMPMAYDDEGKNPLFKIELLSTGGERQFDTNAIINRYDERIAMSMLADFILMGHQAVGSFALSTTKTGLFSTALSAILDVIAAEINLQAVPQLCLLNGFKIEHVPTLMHGNIEAADLAKLGEFLKSLADSGMAVFPNEALETFLLEAAGLPSDSGAGELPLGEDEALLDPNAQPVVTDLATGQPKLPAPAPKQLPAPGAKPAAAKPATAKPKPAAAAPAPRRSTERKPPRFVPLAQRVAKVGVQLSEQMETEDYKDFLAAVMDAGRFSSLPLAYQELIRQAESAE